MKKYNSYKESGIEWLGEIPAHWELKKLKYVAAINPSKSNVLAGVDEELPVTFLPMEKVSENGTVETDIKKPVKELINGFTFFQEKDVIVAKITPCFENGKGAYLENLDSPFGFGSTEFHVLRGYDQVLLNEYLYFVTKSNLFMELGEGSMAGAGGQKRVPTSFLQDYLITYPESVHEQQIIVDFIKAKTTQIDSLIQKKQQMIALLEEEKTAVVNEAVTKGLNPDAPMKDSGIEWLGMVPAHWEIRKVSRSFSTIGSGTTPESGNPLYHENGTIPWVNTGDLNDGVLDTVNKKITEQAFDRYSLKVYPTGSLIIAMYGATIGKVAILGFEACTNQACCVLGDSSVFLTKFAYYFFLANKQHIVSLGYGGGQPNISQELIRGLRIPAPSLEEQKQIIDHLEKETSRIEQIKQKFNQEISLMKEYRTALISEAVTGKIDVRDYQPEPITSTALA